MSGFEIFLIVVIIIFSIYAYIRLFAVFCVVEALCDKIIVPLTNLLNLFINRDSHFSGSSFVRCAIMVLIFLGSAGFLVFYCTIGSVQECFQTILDGTALGSLSKLAMDGFSPSSSINFPTMVSAGLSSFISLLYMRYTIETLDEMYIPRLVYWILIALFNVAFMCITGLLSAYWAEWCISAAEYLQEVYNELVTIFNSKSPNPFLGLINFIGTGLLLLSLLYAAFLTFTIVVREYLASLCYGIFNLAFLVVFTLIFQEWLHMPEFVLSTIALLSIISTEYIRANEDAKIWFRDLVLSNL